jgi:hypothetical protein
LSEVHIILYTVYGPANGDRKQDFFDELHNIMTDTKISIIMGETLT